MMNYICNSAVLLCAFNRPEKTKSVLSAIRAVRPSKLYFACDGARNDQEKNIVAEVRSLIQTIDWPCRIQTLYSDTNQGCGRAVQAAIHWFFQNEEEGIILEDDTLPTADFFQWCEFFLERYRYDNKIHGICGTNPGSQSSGSVFHVPVDLSRYFFCWGWATWQRCAGKFTISPDLWSEDQFRVFPQVAKMGSFEESFWNMRFHKAYAGEFDTWDYQMMHESWLNDRLWVVPRKNLVSNIGFGANATHTKNSATEENAAPAKELRDQLREAKSHDPCQDETREAIRFLNIFNKDWAGVGNLLASNEQHGRLISFKKKCFELEQILNSPTKLVSYYSQKLFSRLF